MSHIDELDEFEAQLELGLKKEYSAVFGLFRYCVLTQDANHAPLATSSISSTCRSRASTSSV